MPGGCAAAAADFRQLEVLWTLLVGAVAIGVLAVDSLSSNAAASAASASAVADAARVAATRARLVLEPLPAALATTQAALSYIPAPWGVGTWAAVSAPLVLSAVPQAHATAALAARVAGPDRAAWEAQMSTIYGSPVQVMEPSGEIERAMRARAHPHAR